MIWVLLSVLAFLFVFVHGEIEEGCSVPYPTFCTNVNWAVSDDVIDDMITTVCVLFVRLFN